MQRSKASTIHVILSAPHAVAPNASPVAQRRPERVVDLHGSWYDTLLDPFVTEPLQGAVDTGTRKHQYRALKELLFDQTVDPAASYLTTHVMALLGLYADGRRRARERHRRSHVDPNATLADDEQLLYTGKPDKNRPFKKQVVKDKCHYCHKIGHHAFECRFKKRDLAKGISRKSIPIEGEDQINILKHDDDTDEGFILATTDVSPRSDIEDAWILDSACTADVTGDKTLFAKLARTRPSTM
ncbi:Aste57867_20271 [Aphanomyces stellatus]|uniref:Aste57867_20271 protein n=1 Tax=Aphanomyces stellatus TaxID=120398 RepID=A0A485LFU0_9STRA|nr:hypothetical protein As57867_020205 [Aphanomyces stellatus]VFT96961.1 Aste57867_20271 [Aphanomyces stellatus]